MNPHTQRLLGRVRSFLESYRQGDLSLSYLVSGLEASLNALEEPIQGNFYQKWYVYWGRLEEILALDMESEHNDEVLENIQGLERLINAALQSATG